MTNVCIPQFAIIPIGSQRSEARGCANGYPEGNLTHIAMFEVTVKAMLDVTSSLYGFVSMPPSRTETEARRFKPHNR